MKIRSFHYNPTVRLLLAFLLCIPLLAAQGKDIYWTPKSLPMVHLQDAARYVCNPDGILPQAAVDSLDRELALLEKETGVQTVAIVVGHIEGDDPYSFGQELADKYGIGHKGRDDGLIVLLCTLDRSYSILTGDGLEGVLPDATCFRVEQDVMIPLLKKGEWSEAMLATIHTLDRCIRQDPAMSAYTQAEEDDGGDAVVAVGAGAILLGLFMFALHRGRRKCPKCGKRKLKYIKRERMKVNGRRIIRSTYVCKKCGHSGFFDQNEVTSSGSGSSYSGGRSYSSRSSGGFSSRSSGGSFGGGHFGGGGASGRF